MWIVAFAANEKMRIGYNALITAVKTWSKTMKPEIFIGALYHNN